MFQNDFATFLLELRKKNNISQQELADRLYVDRSLISKWENGKLLPDVKYFDSLCNIFNISLTELLSCKIGSKEDEVVINYIKNNNKKKNVLKKSLIISVLLVFVISFIFLFYYFTNNYNKVNVYRIDCIYDDFEIKDGLLIIAGDNTYLKIGSIRSLSFDSFGEEIQDIKIYNEDDLLYQGNSKKVVNDIKITKDNIYDIYIEINDIKYPLNFINVYSNKKIIYS